MWMKSWHLAGTVTAAAAGFGILAFSRGKAHDENSTTRNIWRETVFRIQKAQSTKLAILPDPVPSTKWDHNWDKREPESLMKLKDLQSLDPKEREEALKKLKATASRHIILIRHGQYNLGGLTDKAAFLTPLGREQASLTGQRLRELGLKFDSLLSSTMTRAVESADCIAQGLPAGLERIEDSMLEEGAPYPPDPPIPPEASAPRPFDFAVDGARIEAAFRKHFHRAAPTQEKDSYEIVVCHANVIRYFLCRALQLPPEAWLRLALAHSSLTWLGTTHKLDEQIVKHQVSEFSMGWNPNVELLSAWGCALSAQPHALDSSTFGFNSIENSDT